jgi:hypothetical protein
VEADQALERFLKFHPPQFLVKADQEQEAKSWMKQIDDLCAALNYTKQRKVHLQCLDSKDQSGISGLEKEAREQEQEE